MENILCNHITNFLESIAPIELAEEWDNVGLLVGDSKSVINKIMVCVDITNDIIDECVEKSIDLIVSHHPLIFKGIKKIEKGSVLGNILYKSIQNNISIYSYHTNLDIATHGTNYFLSQALNLKSITGLVPRKFNNLYKLVVFVPEKNIDPVRDAIHNSGAGFIGNYKDCSFYTKGTGTFRPLAGSNPHIGSLNTLEYVNEFRLETIVQEHLLSKVIHAMLEVHPYEEIAYDLIPLKQKSITHSLGTVGLLESPQSLEEFIVTVKNSLDVNYIKLIGNISKKIEKVAVFCGAFDPTAINTVLNSNADVLVTGDLKHHTALEMKELGMCVIDGGHFDTEKFMVSNITNLLKEKFSHIQVFKSNKSCCPFKYC